MTLARWAAVATLAAAFHLQAQSPAPPSPPPPATGPTMEQSFAFINDAFTKQGNVSYKVTGGPCLDFQTWEIRNLAVWHMGFRKHNPQSMVPESLFLVPCSLFLVHSQRNRNKLRSYATI
jgi:hypothetical protein